MTTVGFFLFIIPYFLISLNCFWWPLVNGALKKKKKNIKTHSPPRPHSNRPGGANCFYYYIFSFRSREPFLLGTISRSTAKYQPVASGQHVHTSIRGSTTIIAFALITPVRYCTRATRRHEPTVRTTARRPKPSTSVAYAYTFIIDKKKKSKSNILFGLPLGRLCLIL